LTWFDTASSSLLLDTGEPLFSSIYVAEQAVEHHARINLIGNGVVGVRHEIVFM
jgi:hypothetical protein